MPHVLHSLLAAGAEAAYETAHRQVPGDLAAALRRAGIRDWTIHRTGRHLIHLIDCDDLPAAFAALAGEPANDRWQRVIGVHVDRFEPAGADGVPRAIAPLWRLADQPAATPEDAR